MEGDMIEVKRAGDKGRTWGVYLNGELFEGGFFTREAAERAAEELRADYRGETR